MSLVFSSLVGFIKLEYRFVVLSHFDFNFSVYLLAIAFFTRVYYQSYFKQVYNRSYFIAIFFQHLILILFSQLPIFCLTITIIYIIFATASFTTISHSQSIKIIFSSSNF